MKLERRAELIYEAYKENGLDGHVTRIEGRRRAQTWAERIAVRFKGSDPLPVKNSYMYCDTLDMCFFYGGPSGDIPYMTYAGYVTAGSPDITEGKLAEAFKKADAVLRLMKKYAEEASRK